MSMQDHSHSESEPPHNFLTSRAGLVFIGFAIIAGALLFTEHRAHVLGLLIWLPLLRSQKEVRLDGDRKHHQLWRLLRSARSRYLYDHPHNPAI